MNEFYPDIAFHPGRTLKEKLKELNITTSVFSMMINMPVEDIRLFIYEKRGVTEEMANLFEAVLGIPAYFWLDMQRDYDEFMEKKGNE